MSLVPLAPLGMTTLLPRDDRHKIAHWFLFRDRKCTSVGALKPKGAGGAAVEIERPQNFEIRNGDRRKNARQIGQSHVRAKSQSGFVSRSNGCKSPARGPR